jgi:hypothetical protein
VKHLRTDKDSQVFHLLKREKQALLRTLNLYPLVPETHHRLSKGIDVPEADENQRLLEEALAEQRQENRRQVLALLESPERFRETKTGYELTLTSGEIEWLLQVLNDVRVGCWLILGQPEEGGALQVTDPKAKFEFALELCGLFQSNLLAGLGVDEPLDDSGE